MSHIMYMTDGGGGGSIPSVSIVEGIRQKVEDSIRRDEIEFTSGEAALKACGVDFTIDTDAIAAMVASARQAVEAISSQDVELWHEGFSAPAELRGLSAGWEVLSVRLEQVVKQAETLQIESWKGTGADAYRSKIPVFQEAGENLKKISTSVASNSDTTAGRVEDANNAYLNTLLTIQSGVVGPAGKAARTSWPSRNWFQRLFGMKGGAKGFSFNFYTRTAACNRALQSGLQSLSELANSKIPDYDAYEVLADRISDAGIPLQLHGMSGREEAATTTPTEESSETRRSVYYKEGA